jgi:hypothetical protein
MPLPSALRPVIVPPPLPSSTTDGFCIEQPSITPSQWLAPCIRFFASDQWPYQTQQCSSSAYGSLVWGINCGSYEFNNLQDNYYKNKPMCMYVCTNRNGQPGSNSTDLSWMPLNAGNLFMSAA